MRKNNSEYCADCGIPIGYDQGPLDGWQLEDGRTVCQKCAVKDLGDKIKEFISFGKRHQNDQ